MTDQFIKERLYLKGVSSKTVAWYGDSFKAFPVLERAAIIDRIAELRGRGVKAVSINTWLRCVNTYLHWRDGTGEKCSPQCTHVRIPRLKEEQKILETLGEGAKHSVVSFRPTGTNMRRAHLVALTILDCGLRASEVLGLTKADCDLDNLIFKVLGKGNRHRLVPFSSELRKHLWRYVNQRSLITVFGTKNNTNLSVRNLERDFRVLGQKLGITGVRFSPHTLRHTFAVSYLRAGGNLEFLRRILGHSSLSTTQKYLNSLGVEDLGAVHQQFSPLSTTRQNGR